MKKCKSCQSEIDAKAKKCPHCQADQRNWFIRHPILTVLLVFFILGIIGAAGGKQTSINEATTSEEPIVQEVKTEETIPPTEIQLITISASKLFAAYEENAIKADEMYKDKILEVSGISGNISKDITDTMYVTLKTDNLLGSIQCYLPENEKDKAMSLKPDKQITVRGRNSGKLINILLKDCVIISM